MRWNRAEVKSPSASHTYKHRNVHLRTTTHKYENTHTYRYTHAHATVAQTPIMLMQTLRKPATLVNTIGRIHEKKMVRIERPVIPP